MRRQLNCLRTFMLFTTPDTLAPLQIAPSAADGGRSQHVPARPGCTTPHIRFLFIAPQLGVQFLSRAHLAVTPLQFP